MGAGGASVKGESVLLTVSWSTQHGQWGSAWAGRAGCAPEDTSFHGQPGSAQGCWLLPLLPAGVASAVCPPIAQELSLPLSCHPSAARVQP